MFRSNNVAARIFERQISTPAPGTTIHCARRFYENIVPSHTIYDIECPDLLFRKFSDDGQYLITFSRNNQDLIVYRPTWLSFSCKDQNCHVHDLPSKANKFESFFTQLYSVTLASSGELICKDFFLYTERNQFGIFATSTAQIHDVPADGGAIQGVPSIEKITFHLVRLEDGVILDERVFCNDYINLAHSMGVFLYDDLLAVVSLRYQRINILQIRDSGNLVDVRAIGEFCREDDELFLNSSAQCMALPDKNKLNQVATHNIGNGSHGIQHIPEASFLSGLKQRLLSFIVRGIWNEEDDPTLVSRIKINENTGAIDLFVAFFYLVIRIKCLPCSYMLIKRNTGSFNILGFYIYFVKEGLACKEYALVFWILNNLLTFINFLFSHLHRVFMSCYLLLARCSEHFLESAVFSRFLTENGLQLMPPESFPFIPNL